MLTPAAAFVLPCLTTTTTMLLGAAKTDVMLYAFNKAIQDENDEQLRIMNERKIDNKELRQLIVEMRDRDYDTM